LLGAATSQSVTCLRDPSSPSRSSHLARAASTHPCSPPHLLLKHSRLEAAGCPAYWVIDPDVPSLIAWELRNGTYAQVAMTSGDETYSAHKPYPVEFSAADLID
jgi:hypothetical protein